MYIKYNQAGPNYQYYPTTLGFQETIKHEDIVKKMIALNGKEINMKLFFPYSRDPDFHSINYQIQLTDDSQLNTYIETIKNELIIYKKHINKAKIVEIYFSGSDVSLLGISQLSKLLNIIENSFSIDLKTVKLSIDINARHFNKNQFKALKKMGFNSLNISTLNFNYNLQVAHKQPQSYQHVNALIKEAKKVDFAEVNIELIYGLPNETYENMRNTVSALIALNCEYVCMTRYFHRPFVFKLQKYLDQAHLPSTNENYYTYKMCVDKLLVSGYEHLGMNCFVSSDSKLFAARNKHILSYNHTGYTLNTHNDVVALGAASISKVNALFYQNSIKITDYIRSVLKGRIPNGKGCSLSAEQLFRKEIIKGLIIDNYFEFNHGRKRQMKLLKYIDETFIHLNEMANDGLVNISEKSINVTEIGKYFLKNICALFDLNMIELIYYETNE